MSIRPTPHRPRFRPDLSPGLTAREAFVIIGRGLLADIRFHEPDVRADRHPEYLHQLRVAVRRQRSCCGHFKRALDAEALRRHREGFARLGGVTGPLRDLDVDLEVRPSYLALLPEDLRPGLEPRFQRLSLARQRELARVRRVLDAPWYRWLLHDWEQYLASPAPGPEAEVPVLALIRRRLGELHRRVLAHGAEITRGSPDASLHRLRIRCKKLRYLLEFATTLFAKERVPTVVGHLKGLQDNLGEYNDLCVQQAGWRGASAEIDAPEEAMAVDALLELLAARQEAVKGEFNDTFEAFAAPEVTEQMAQLTRT